MNVLTGQCLNFSPSFSNGDIWMCSNITYIIAGLNTWRGGMIVPAHFAKNKSALGSATVAAHQSDLATPNDRVGLGYLNSRSQPFVSSPRASKHGPEPFVAFWSP